MAGDAEGDPLAPEEVERGGTRPFLKLVGELGMTEVAEEVFEWFAAKTVNLGS